MDSLPLLKPELYTPGPVPTLRGGACTCGHLFFPMQAHGCEKCGLSGDALTPRDLSGKGRLNALAKVHLHAGKARKAPFTVATIQLDDGPVVRTLLDTESEDAIRPGDMVVARLLPVAGEDGVQALDLRFALAR